MGLEVVCLSIVIVMAAPGGGREHRAGGRAGTRSGGASFGRWSSGRGTGELDAGVSASGPGSALEHLRGCGPVPDPSWADADSGVCGTEEEDFGLNRDVAGFPGKFLTRQADR